MQHETQEFKPSQHVSLQLELHSDNIALDLLKDVLSLSAAASAGNLVRCLS